MAISMHLFFQSVHSTPTKSEVEIDKENTQKNKKRSRIFTFLKEKPQNVYFKY